MYEIDAVKTEGVTRSLAQWLIPDVLMHCLTVLLLHQLALLARFTALARSLSRSPTRFYARGKEIYVQV